MALIVVTDPSREVAENAALELLISSWVAVHNPIIYDMQRKDYTSEVTHIIVSGTGTIGEIRVNVASTEARIATLVAGQYIYLNSASVTGTFLVTSKSGSSPVSIFIEMDGTIADGSKSVTSAFLNLSNLAGYYCQVEIGTVTDGTYLALATAKFKPFLDGTFTIDPSAWLQRLAVITDAFDYIDSTWRDLALGNGFKMKYRERYNAEASVPSYPDPGTFYYVNAAMQIGDPFGQNMGEYVTFNAAPPVYPAKFLTLFSTPIYYNNFPFDIAIIRSELVAGLSLQFRTVNYNVNGGVVGFAGFEALVDTIGIHRLLPVPNGSPSYITIEILDDPGLAVFSEVKTINISSDCPDYPIYLKWINTLGGWSYWLFAFDQQKSINIGDAVTYENNITELSTADAKLEYLSKRAFPKIVCGANNVSTANLAGLKGLLYSPKVMMLTNPDTWETDGAGATPLPKFQTVLVQPGSFNLETTRRGVADVEITLQVVEINVQTQ
jgi:hypothetical protein